MFNQKKINRTAGATGAVVFCALGCAGSAKAQQILTPPPAVNTTPPAVAEIQGEGVGSVLSAPELPSAANWQQWGPITVRPHFDYQISYTTGMQSALGTSQDTLVQTVSPGVLFNIGTHWSVDYTPTLSYYSGSQFQNNTSHNVSVIGGAAYGDWLFSFQQLVLLTFAPDFQTGAQTSSKIYETALSASYRFNSKLSLDTSASQTLTYLTQPDNGVPVQNDMTWSTQEYLNYQFFPRLTAGIGVGASYDDVQGGPDMTAEQLNARVEWRITDKSSLSVSGGVEDRQFLSGGLSDLISPIFGVEFAWHPVDPTTITLGANRSISPSPLQDEITTTTALNANLRQRLLGKFTLGLNASYNNSDYTAATVASAAQDRSDNYYALSARLDWAFWNRASASIFYTYSQDTSTISAFSFNSSQAGFEIAYRF